jgi:osmotically inducible lipoprotein OsmB
MPVSLATARRRGAMNPRHAVAVAFMALAVGGCATMTPTEQRMLSGGAIGTAAGAGIAAVAGGNVAAGAAIGAGAGAVGGYLYDRTQRRDVPHRRAPDGN